MNRLLTKKAALLLLLALVGLLTAAHGPAAPRGDDALFLDLRTAVELARQANVELLLAQQELERARLGLRQVRAMSLIEPSPALLLQAEAGVTLAERSARLNRSDWRLTRRKRTTTCCGCKTWWPCWSDVAQMAARQLEVAETADRRG